MKRCILCLAALSLAACGSSGALYLPGHEKPKTNLLKKQERKNGVAPASAPAATQQPAAPAAGSVPDAPSTLAPSPAPVPSNNPAPSTNPAPQPQP